MASPKVALALAAFGVVILATVSTRKEPMSVFGKRMAIVETALNEVGESDSSKYGAAPGVDWCGIFDLWVYHQNGVLLQVEWAYAEDINHDGKTDYGFLMVPPYALKMTNDPQPGDIAYFNRNQHHAMVSAVRDDEVDLVNGNGIGGKVTVSTVKKSAVTAFFSVEDYLMDSVLPEGNA